VTTPAGTSQTTLTFAAAADATVKESSAGSNYGTITTLKADGGTGTHVAAYLRFAVTGIPVGQTVQSATLRLYVPSDGTTAGPGVYGVTDSSWGEQTITWSNRPSASTTATAQLGAIAAGTWAEYPVTPLVIGNGTYSFAVGPSATDDGVVFNAREAGSNTPQLVVTTG
jgi:hypothetical protein